jgi:hypothetical protein
MGGPIGIVSIVHEQGKKVSQQAKSVVLVYVLVMYYKSFATVGPGRNKKELI